jgi:hypothetical protein
VNRGKRSGGVRGRPATVDSAFMIRSVLVLAGIAVLLGLTSSLVMRLINRKLDIEEPAPREETAQAEQQLPDTLATVEYTPVEPDITTEEVAPWDPRWPAAPCSVFVGENSAPVLDTIPEALSPDMIPVETQYLIESWGRASGLEETEIDRLWAFNRFDTLYVDMPRSMDIGGLKRTLEGRFVCYTLLIPLVNGQVLESAGSGIPLAGVPGVFSR